MDLGPGAQSMQVEEADSVSQEQLAVILEQKRQAVQAELQRLERLPAHSQYVVHRRAVATKALELLNKQDRTTEEADELSSLLGALSI